MHIYNNSSWWGGRGSIVDILTIIIINTVQNEETNEGLKKYVNPSSRSNHSEMVSIRPFSSSSPRVVLCEAYCLPHSLCLPSPSDSKTNRIEKSSPIFYPYRNKQHALSISNDNKGVAIQGTIRRVDIQGGWQGGWNGAAKYENTSLGHFFRIFRGGDGDQRDPRARLPTFFIKNSRRVPKQEAPY